MAYKKKTLISFDIYLCMCCCVLFVVVGGIMLNMYAGWAHQWTQQLKRKYIYIYLGPALILEGAI